MKIDTIEAIALLETKAHRRLVEYQVGSGTKYMKRKLRKNKPKNKNYQNAALERWRKHGDKIRSAIQKYKDSAKGRLISRALGDYLKRRYQMSSSAVDMSPFQMMFDWVTCQLPDVEILAGLTPYLVESDEFLIDMALIFDPVLVLESKSKYMTFFKGKMKEFGVKSPGELSKKQWAVIKREWASLKSKGKNESLVESVVEESELTGKALEEMFPPMAKNEPTEYPIGLDVDISADYFMTARGRCPVCGKHYFYRIEKGDPGVCPEHNDRPGGPLSYMEDPVMAQKAAEESTDKVK